MNLQELSQKLINHGDNSLRLIRVSETTGSRNRFLGNIIISCRHYMEGVDEIFSVRVVPVTSILARSSSMPADKLSINKFEAYINHSEHTVRFGPLTGAQMEEPLQNLGVGTYAFNWLVQELRRGVGNYSVNPFELTLQDDMTISQKERMMAFLTKFGINFNFTDLEQKNGTMRAATPNQIVCHYNADKIQELDMEEFLFSLISDRHKNESEIKNMKLEIERMGEESFAGIPKKQLVKYTLIACGVTIALIFLLII